ncbi:substrate-binding domain-containing protein [Rhodobacter sp. 24-YEA-8]|uniref:sugar ABC transporter substrate-binding protein n=1 Tax=Rhodobacter sp. 24-YEA-8 TaxID=1884310 RepID=UPI00089A9A2F|nr:substrate-binding domain-containing protein [Rhodobacter sp. 24-YEA-8]SED47949.1 monosaccharide ABC transporter substrate-binding protein, CUT2 family [Rhodobacter sp. 24-YEA-8]
MKIRNAFLRRLTLSAGAVLVLAPGPAAAQEDPVAFAKDVVEQASKSVMSLDEMGKGAVIWAGPESSPPPARDVTVAVMPCPLSLSVCQKNLAYASEAAKAIGWKVIPIDTRGDPGTAQRGVDAALNKGAQCVLLLASPARDIRAQIQRGKEKGVAFVVSFADDPVPYGGDVGYGIDQATAGKLLAAYVVANGGGKVVLLGAPAFPQLSARLQGFRDYLAEYGGDTTVVLEEVEFNVGAGAPDLVTKTQALLTKYPQDSFQWVLTPYDEALVPVLATMRQRDRTEIHGLSFDGEPVAISSILGDKAQAATISWGLEWAAWAGIDECNRALNKSEVGVHHDFPLQLTTAANAVAGGVYDPGLDFKAHFKAMWAGGN